jgi:hypothetical protein
MEGRYEVRRVDVLFRLPSVMCFGISFPPDSILKYLLAPEVPHANNAFNFPFFISVDQFRWGFWKVTSMFLRFLVW